jgi:hypothetical protein
MCTNRTSGSEKCLQVFSNGILDVAPVSIPMLKIWEIAEEHANLEAETEVSSETSVYISLHGAIFSKAVVFTVTAVRISHISFFLSSSSFSSSSFSSSFSSFSSSSSSFLLLLLYYSKSACSDVTRFTFSEHDLSLGNCSVYTVGSVSTFYHQTFCLNSLYSSVGVRIFYSMLNHTVFSLLSCLHS